ncbi:F-box protein At3g07870-like [Pistacia vera]|uniref:F-box protein At3g07870-like n=1 Tax=Pistacia vera TaxID=55513 RepID=UPI00126316AD|nr:F-box protein At3g07870-like [Pistacia vera]
MEYLPPEVVVNILSRLPVTSLLHCKLVCRAWRSLSKDPHLVSMRFSCVGKNDPSLILHCDYPIQNQLYSLDLSAHDEDNLRVNKICVPTLPEYEVIGSCKCLLCLCDSLTKTQFYIYNPFTRDHKQLLKSIEFPIREVAFRFGFGSHPITKEYKVLKIVYHRTKPRTVRNPVQIYRPESQVQIFTLGSPAWRSLGKIPYVLREISSQVLVSGRLHWQTWPQRYGPDRSLISFDLADEQFRVVPKPTCGGLDGCSFSLVALGGCLSAAVSHKNGQIEIWVMKDYDVKESWTKDFSIGTHVPRGLEKKVPKSFRASKFFNHFPIIRVLCLMKNGNILLVYKGRALVSYDPIMGTFRDIMFDGMPNWFEAVVHEGNLTLIDI